MVLKDNVIISSGLQARWHLRKMIPDSLICLTAPIASLIIYRLRGSQFIFTEQILLCWDLLGPNIQLPNWHPHRNVPKASSRSAHSIFKNHDINIPSLCYAFPRICVFGNKISIQPEKCGVFHTRPTASTTTCGHRQCLSWCFQHRCSPWLLVCAHTSLQEPLLGTFLILFCVSSSCIHFCLWTLNWIPEGHPTPDTS